MDSRLSLLQLLFVCLFAAKTVFSSPVLVQSDQNGASKAALQSLSKPVASRSLVVDPPAISDASSALPPQSTEPSAVPFTCNWFSIHCKIFNGCPWWATDCYNVDSAVKVRQPSTRSEILGKCIGKSDPECDMIHSMLTVEKDAKKMSSSDFCAQYPIFCQKSGCPWWVNEYECFTMTTGEGSESNCSFGTSAYDQKQECNVGGSLSNEILRAGCPWWQWDDC